MRTLKGLAGVAAIAATVSCGDVVRTGRSPVYLVITQLTASNGGTSAGTPSGTLQSDVLTSGSIFNDIGQVSLRISPRDITAPATPSLNNEVTINRYHVIYRRADGRNTPGVDVPYGFDGAVTGTVAVGATLSLDFEIVRHVAKAEPPLVQLVNGATIISTIADVTFYGYDQVGNEVNVTGSILIDFGNFGDH